MARPRPGSPAWRAVPAPRRARGPVSPARRLAPAPARPPPSPAMALPAPARGSVLAHSPIPAGSPRPASAHPCPRCGLAWLRPGARATPPPFQRGRPWRGSASAPRGVLALARRGLELGPACPWRVAWSSAGARAVPRPSARRVPGSACPRPSSARHCARPGVRSWCPARRSSAPPRPCAARPHCTLSCPGLGAAFPARRSSLPRCGLAVARPGPCPCTAWPLRSVAPARCGFSSRGRGAPA
eukprot:XP_020406368.1 uncharacterized protein LOC109945007 [Zea mays]